MGQPLLRYQVALSPAAVRAFEGRSATLAVTSTGTDRLWFYSKAHGTSSYRPQLVLTWS